MKRFIKSAIACIAAVAMIATVAPVTTQAAAKKTVTVTNQKQLEAAIKNGATKITIKTAKNVKITIPASKNAAKATIVVDAKNATITNKATVKGLTVKDAKAFTESGKNNDIKITDTKLTVTVAKASKGAEIQVAKTNANVKVVANGSVASVTVSKKATVAITGKSDSVIDVNATAAGATVSTAVPAAVTADKKATITIKAGADGSTVTANADVKVTVAKNTTVASVEVTAASAKVDLVARGTVTDVTVAESATGANLNITGTTKDTVKVTVDAKDTTVKADTPVDTTLNADAKVDLGAGAEGSKVTQGSDDVKVDVSNGTSDKITITDSTGKDTTVDAGKEQSTATDDNKTEDKKDENTSGGSSTSSGGGSDTPPVLSSAKDITLFEIDGIAGVINDANITVTLPADKKTSLSAVTPDKLSISAAATVSPAATQAVDFSNNKEVIYTVTAQDGSTKSYTVKVASENAVATTKVGDVTIGYTTLDAAVSASNEATGDATVKLYEDDTNRTSPLLFKKKAIILELGGHTISGNIAQGVITVGGKTDALKGSGEISPDYTTMAADVTISGPGTIRNDNTAARVINLYYGSKLVLDGGVNVTYPNAANKGAQTAVCVWGDERAEQNKNAAATRLTVNKATIDKTTFGVSVYGASTVDINDGAVIKSETEADKDPNYAVGGNGLNNTSEKNGGTIINVNGGTIDGGAYNAGIYQPQDGTLNISGGTISGCAGLDIKAGTVNITGGTIQTDNGHYSSDANVISVNDGANAVNSALAIVEKSGYNYGYNVNVTISNGNFTGAVKILRSSEAATNHYKLTINGGTFDPVPVVADYTSTPYQAEGTVDSGNTSNFTVTKSATQP